MKLHLGCGKRYIPGFVHIDIAEFPHIDYSVGIDKLPMLANDSVDLIYCCHAFEYFDRTQAAAVLSEWCRVLKPGGILRLAVPNFEALIKVFAERGELELILGPLFGRIVVQTSQGAATLYHRTVYDYKSLERLLLQSGLRSVRRYNWRETIHKDYDDFSQAYIPHMDKDKGILVSLNVEAIK